jgi:hypothetical protein
VKAGPDWFGARVRAMLRPPRRPIRGTTYGYTAPPPAPSLPSWVPSAGGVTTFTQGGGTLSNNFRAVFDPNGVGYDMFHAKKVVTDYSGQFLHRTWGDYGGLLLWGGGHSATNWNGAVMLTFGETTISFECVLSPFDWAQASLDTGDLSAEINSYGEALVGGSPSSPLRIIGPHSYGCGDFVDGVFVQPALIAGGHQQDFDGLVAHGLDLSNPATSANAREWVRRTNSNGSAGWTWETAPILTRYVPVQGRQFAMAQGGGGPYSMQWFDPVSNTWVTGSGTGFSYPEAQTDGGDPTNGALIYCEGRDLLVAAYRSSGNLVLQYANVASGVSQPSVAGSASLSSALAIPVQWGAIAWCEDSQRILVFGVTSNTDKVYEIEIPADPGDTWTVTSHTLAGGATIVPQPKGVWGKSCEYNPATKCCTFFQAGLAENPTADQVTVYRPRNT